MAKRKALKALTLDEFRQHNTLVRTPCSLYVFLKNMSPEDRKMVREVIADESIQIVAIGRVLRKKLDWKHSDQVILKHRRRECMTCALYKD